MHVEQFPSQDVMNTFVLIMFHMERGNTITKKCHLLRLQEILLRIADDTTIQYITVVPIRPGHNTGELTTAEIQV